MEGKRAGQGRDRERGDCAWRKLEDSVCHKTGHQRKTSGEIKCAINLQDFRETLMILIPQPEMGFSKPQPGTFCMMTSRISSTKAPLIISVKKFHSNGLSWQLQTRQLITLILQLKVLQLKPEKGLFYKTFYDCN